MTNAGGATPRDTGLGKGRPPDMPTHGSHGGAGQADTDGLQQQVAPILDRLLPAVTAWAEQQARQRAADELHATAEEFRRMASPTLSGDPFIRASDWAARIIADRADALEG